MYTHFSSIKNGFILFEEYGITRGNHIKVIKSGSKRQITHFLSFVGPAILDIQNLVYRDNMKIEASRGIKEMGGARNGRVMGIGGNMLKVHFILWWLQYKWLP